MFIQGQTGQPAPYGNNANPVLRAGQLGDAIVSQLLPRYYESTYRDNTFFGGHSALTALTANTIGLTAAATPILGLWNPSSNTKNLVLTYANLTLVANNLTSGAAPGALVWAISLGNGGISTGLIPYNSRSWLQSGSNARFFAGSTALTGLTNNLAIVRGAAFSSPSGLTYTTLASTALLTSYGGWENFDGALFVPPGGVLALLNTVSSTTFSAIGHLSWIEVPT